MANDPGRSPEIWGSYPSPFLDDRLMGYDYWKPHDRQVWYSMLKPNAKGYGIHLSTITDMSCCSGMSGLYTLGEHTFTEDGTPWLVPTIVEWKSVTTLDENNDIIIQDGIVETAMDYPIVAITNCYSPISESRFVLDNIHLEWDFDRAFFDCEPWRVNDKFSCLGVVPMWTILPIRSEFVDDFTLTINALASEAKLDILQYNCMCSLDGYHSDDCASNNYSREKGYGNCDCSFAENIAEEMQLILNNLPVVEAYMNEEQNKLWHFAKQQYAIGWQVLYDLATENESENTWAYYSWQHQSPYLGSPGLEIKAQKESSVSTNSETQQAS